jgi:hypothetical protein
MITRRRILKSAAAPLFLQPGGRADTRVAEENRRAGTVEWQLKHYSFDRGSGSGLRSPRLEGYCSEVSVYPGEKIRFLVSTDPPRRFTIDLYRTGWYGGKGGRHLLRLGPLAGEAQPVPLMGMERVRECAWKPSAELAIPSEWPSGVYLGKLALVDEPVQSYVIFIVKEKRAADILFQASDLTWQAYNKWPGWDSLYDDGLPKQGNGYSYTGPNVRVSFDRPYAQYGQVHEVALSLGSGEYLLWEFPLAFWLEQNGYDVVYCSNLDIERDPDVLKRAKVFLSVGHDEYWTRGMYQNVLAARERGMSLAFLSGNSVYHTIVTYNNLRTFARLKRFDDEHLLMGTRSFGSGYGDWGVTKATHWIFEGTGMRNGDYIAGLVGWEYHGDPAELPGLEVVASAQLNPYSQREATTGRFSAVLFPGPKGNWVFNAGTIWWAEGLSNPPGHAPAGSRLGRTLGVDERVQKITANFLRRALGRAG